MTPTVRIAIAASTFAALAFVQVRARADQAAPSPPNAGSPAAAPPAGAYPPGAYPAPPPGYPPPGYYPAPEPPPEFKPWAVTLNPLGVFIGRYSVNVEYLPARHHGIMVNPSYMSWSTSSGSGLGTTSEEKLTWIGGEVGYHFYTGERGANGFFVGPSLVYMSITDSVTAGGSTASANLTAYGVAVDFGGQHVFANGFTIGGGGGFTFLKATASTSADSFFVKTSGTLPRALFMLGWSF